MLSHLKKLFARSDSKKSAASPETSVVLVNAYSTLCSIPPLDFPHQLHGTRGLDDPQLCEHLNGFTGYVQNRGDGQMTATRYSVIRHIQRTRQHLSFSVAAQDMETLSIWANDANAILFLPDGCIHAPDGAVLVDAQSGAAEPNARVPFPPAAWQRKARTEALLAGSGFNIPDHLPPQLAEPELQLRNGAAVAGRALAAFAAAVRAEALSSGSPLGTDEILARIPAASRFLSPQEQVFLDSENPEQRQVTQFGWRYEGVFVLLWALGLSERLPFPADICDVPWLSDTLLGLDNDVFVKTAHLRPASEILDALDEHYRLHWLTRQAQVQGTATPSGLNGDVVFERHFALNWLICFENADWDEVDTPT